MVKKKTKRITPLQWGFDQNPTAAGVSEYSSLRDEWISKADGDITNYRRNPKTTDKKGVSVKK